MEIEVPKPAKTEAGEVDFAIEVAFASLIAEAKKQGVALNPVLGFMYLPTEQLTRDFQDACRNIITALKP